MDQRAASPSLLHPGRNCWRVERADKAAVIVDADNYFRQVRAAMMKARRRIMLVGWDFDAELVLDRVDEGTDGPDSVGRFIHWLVEANPELEVFLLRWDVGALKTLLKAGTLVTLLRWMTHPRIHIRLDGHHPLGASQHQKIVVLDDTTAFCGGIDMTVDRWDTPEHRDGNPLRRRPNGQSFGPWHDATMAVEGPVATALAEICRRRWQAAGGGALSDATAAGPCWPDSLPVDFSDLPVAISRTYPDMDDQAAVHEIEHLYVDLIASARHHIYAESQYFASRAVAQAIAKRIDEPDGPEIVVINPESSEGWLEPVAMDTARARLAKALALRDPASRFRLYHPQTAGGVPIYVHAKILIIDDRMIRVGSSNLNNRSMRLDSECDISIDACLADAGDTVRCTIARLRASLLAEHLGRDAEEVEHALAQTGSLVETIDRLRREGGRTLMPYRRPELDETERWLADNEILDPEGPDAMFEPLSKRGLFRRNSLDFRIRHRGHKAKHARGS